MGDVNNDGEFDIADATMMQKYLLGAGELTAWKNGDMDGRLDVYDFILMRQELRNIPEFNPSYVPENSDPNLDYTAKNLTVDIQSNEVEGAEYNEEFILGQTEFALSLFKKELKNNENTLVSPYSVMQALSMTANGADGATKAEMENALGMPVETLNKYLYTQRTSQHSDENSKLSTANSVWTRSDVGVNQDFLQINVDYYNADFSNMMDRESYISRVIHKTHIDVDEAGTKAGAATVIEATDTAVWAEEYIGFDRPFFCCIIDTETNIPVFMGILMSIPE